MKKNFVQRENFQSIDLVIFNDTLYWFLLSKSPLSQSEALLDKSRSALLECAIHVFNSVCVCFNFNQKKVLISIKKMKKKLSSAKTSNQLISS